jgi:hypothetical protein
MHVRLAGDVWAPYLLCLRAPVVVLLQAIYMQGTTFIGVGKRSDRFQGSKKKASSMHHREAVQQRNYWHPTDAAVKTTPTGCRFNAGCTAASGFLFHCRMQAVLFPPLLNGMYGGDVVPNLSTDARTLSIEAMQQGGADDSQRPASAAQAGEEFEQHAISQPIAVCPLEGLLPPSPCSVRLRL